MLIEVMMGPEVLFSQGAHGDREFGFLDAHR
jgi:hypothetical protein